MEPPPWSRHSITSERGPSRTDPGLAQPGEDLVAAEVAQLGQLGAGHPAGQLGADGGHVGVDGEAGEPVVVVREDDPAGLEQLGENLYAETPASGQPNSGPAGDGNRGRIKQGFLEGSNVDPTRELIELIRTQRAFEMNSNSIRAADDTLRAVAQLRR